MLLRSDLSAFISNHHKKQEFSHLREVEQLERFAYLAGHGRNMLQGLAAKTEYNSKFSYTSIVKTMEKLQLIYALEYSARIRNSSLDNPNNEEISNSFPFDKINFDELKKIKEMGEHIMQIQDIENKLNPNECQLRCTIEDSIVLHFNPDLLKFICFELFVNAKKNRFHFIKQDSCDCNFHENTFSFNIVTFEDGFELQVSNYGPAIPNKAYKKLQSLSKSRSVKGNNEVAGTTLISNVLKALNKDNYLDYRQKELCDTCKVNEVTAIVKVKTNG